MFLRECMRVGACGCGCGWRERERESAPSFDSDNQIKIGKKFQVMIRVSFVSLLSLNRPINLVGAETLAQATFQRATINRVC